MPTAQTIYITSVDSLDKDVWRYNALSALSGMGTVDETTLKITNIDEVGNFDLGTPADPHLICLWQLNLMAVTFEAEVEPNDYQKAVLESRIVERDV